MTRERVGIEFSKMLKGPDPVGALALIAELNLLDVVFTISTVPQNKKKKGEARKYGNPKPIVWTADQWHNALFRVKTVCR